MPGATASPSTTAGTGAVPAATTTGLAAAHPSTVAAIGHVPHPLATGAGSGGGGGSAAGVNDIWAIKALG